MDDMRNIYSFLLLTGYLKAVNKADNEYELMIPNSEVREIYRKQFDEWFDKEETRYGSKLMKALLAGNEEAATKLITAFLSNTVSYYDESENGYHMLLLGLLGSDRVQSNREYGKGRTDLVCVPETVYDSGFVIECKYTRDATQLKKMSEQAVRQIVQTGYVDSLNSQGYTKIHGYGIAFSHKKCFISKMMIGAKK